MLEIRDLTITILKDDKTIVRGLSFVVNDGEKCALIGEEGNGKSTLLRWLYDSASVEGYALVSGRRRVDGTCGYLAQELPPEEAELPVREWMERSCRLSERSPKEIARAAEQLGLDAELFGEKRAVRSLSGGERVKLRIAALLLSECDVLLLDEPSNDLDIDTLEWLEGFLRSTPKTVLYVSHDEVLLENTARMLLHFEQVRRKTIPRVAAVRMGYREYMDRREADMAHRTQVADFEQAAFRKKKDRYLSIRQSVESAQAGISRKDPHGGALLKKKMHSVQSLGKRMEKEEAALVQRPEAEWAILPKIEEGVSLKSGKTVLDLGPERLEAEGRVLAENVRLFVRGPEKICIVGRNGCGKTTLMRRIAEELLPRTDIRAFYMPQRYEETLDPGMLPVELLVPGGEKDAVTKARLYLGSMKYTTDEMEHPIGMLSGGQRAKLLLLKAILEEANVLLLDEPTRNFSPLSAPAVRSLLGDFPGAVIAVSHDRRLIEEVMTGVYRLTPDGLVRER